MENLHPKTTLNEFYEQAVLWKRSVVIKKIKTANQNKTHFIKIYIYIYYFSLNIIKLIRDSINEDLSQAKNLETYNNNTRKK